LTRWLGFWPTLIGLTAASIIFLWWTDVPLGFPEEWVWDRISSADLTDVLLGWAQAALVAAIYLGFVWLGAKRLSRCSRPETACWLSGLVAVGFSWLWVLQESPPVNYRTSKVAWVLYFPGSSGYFQEARYHMQDVATYLGSYEDLMAEGDVLHIGTHPPGLILFHRASITLCHRSLGLTRLLLQSQPQSIRDAFSVIAETSRTTDADLLTEDQAAIWLAALITQFAAVATVVPLYFLLRRDYSRVTSWMSVSFWPLFPAIAIFLPKSDALYPVLAVGFLYCWLDGCRRRSAWMCALAASLLWLGMFLSLAFLPIAFLAGLLIVWEACFSIAEEPRHALAKRAGVAAVWTVSTFLVLTALLWLVYDLNLFKVWLLNFRNHAGFYHQFPRTYWMWLLVNPIELTIAAGVPVVLLVGASYLTARIGILSRRDRSAGPFWCCAIAWGLLWVSGKNMGEAARLWIPLMPCLVWLTAQNWEVPATSAGEQTQKSYRNRWLAVVLLQAVVCIATVTRVDGFQLTRYLKQPHPLATKNTPDSASDQSS